MVWLMLVLCMYVHDISVEVSTQGCALIEAYGHTYVPHMCHYLVGLPAVGMTACSTCPFLYCVQSCRLPSMSCSNYIYIPGCK
jgi:hypothetical protein